jgi:hypothetical protein
MLELPLTAIPLDPVQAIRLAQQYGRLVITRSSL